MAVYNYSYWVRSNISLWMLNFSRVNIGLFCSTPGVALARAVPRKIALEMLFTGNPITAEGEGDLEIIVYQFEGVFLKDDFLF